MREIFDCKEFCLVLIRSPIPCLAERITAPINRMRWLCVKNPSGVQMPFFVVPADRETPWYKVTEV
jgi:hypothetical protein